MWQYNYSDTLYHHGIKGQKWGVRRYQNEDGSLTEAGKKRVSKQYKKLAVKTANELNKKNTDLYVQAYNKSAHQMNDGGIDKFNAEQEKKYGKNFANRDGYEDDYMTLFDKVLEKNLNEVLDDFYSSNNNHRKAQELVDKYKMTEWDELAKANTETINEIKKALGK